MTGIVSNKHGLEKQLFLVKPERDAYLPFNKTCGKPIAVIQKVSRNPAHFKNYSKSSLVLEIYLCVLHFNIQYGIGQMSARPEVLWQTLKRLSKSPLNEVRSRGSFVRVLCVRKGGGREKRKTWRRTCTKTQLLAVKAITPALAGEQLGNNLLTSQACSARDYNQLYRKTGASQARGNKTVKHCAKFKYVGKQYR